jgi:ABC-2 type transport system permease protein
MLATFTHALRRSLGSILGWGISLALLGYLMIFFYDAFAEQQASMQQLLESYPPEIMAFLGGSIDLFTPEGFLGVEFFSYMPLVLGIYAVLAGSSLLIGDEENGTLDLILAHPVSRTRLFFGRLVALCTSLAIILAIAWLAFLAGVSQSEGMASLTALDLMRPFLSLYALLLLFGGLCLLLSMVLPSRNMAAMVGGLILVGSYFIQSLSTINEQLEKVAPYLPLHYYQSSQAVSKLNGNWLAGLAAAALLFILLAWWLFLRRDIRVSGEGSWRRPWFRPGRRPLASGGTYE